MHFFESSNDCITEEKMSTFQVTKKLVGEDCSEPTVMCNDNMNLACIDGVCDCKEGTYVDLADPENPRCGESPSPLSSLF